MISKKLQQFVLCFFATIHYYFYWVTFTISTLFCDQIFSRSELVLTAVLSTKNVGKNGRFAKVSTLVALKLFLEKQYNSLDYISQFLPNTNKTSFGVFGLELQTRMTQLSQLRLDFGKTNYLQSLERHLSKSCFSAIFLFQAPQSSRV